MSKPVSNFPRQAIKRISVVSLLLSLTFGVITWFFSIEQFENNLISLGYEEATRIMAYESKIIRDRQSKISLYEDHRLAGGLFDIVEIYNQSGDKVLEAVTERGELIEKQLPPHNFPQMTEKNYQSFSLKDLWVIRVFVPIESLGEDFSQSSLSYFEGVRVIPDWQHDQIYSEALILSLMVAAASVFCGLLIYPLVVHLSKDNERKTLEVLDSHISMMEALGRAIAKRDSDTGIHNYRVAWIASKIAEKTGMTGNEMQSLIAGSFLHDVGKIGITDAILLKPGKLTKEEFEIMKTHVDQGEEIVKGMGWLHGAHEIVSAHHEKWNGTGYPRGLSEDNIPLAARIFAIADVFDALSSKRPYKEPLPLDKVMEIMANDTDTHFDKELMKIFTPMVDEISQTLNGLNEDQARKLLQSQIHKHFYIKD